MGVRICKSNFRRSSGVKYVLVALAWYLGEADLEQV